MGTSSSSEPRVRPTPVAACTIFIGRPADATSLKNAAIPVQFQVKASPIEHPLAAKQSPASRTRD